MSVNPALAASSSLRFMDVPSNKLLLVRGSADWASALLIRASHGHKACSWICLALAQCQYYCPASDDYFGCDRSMLETLYHTIFHELSL